MTGNRKVARAGLLTLALFAALSLTACAASTTAEVASIKEDSGSQQEASDAQPDPAADQLEFYGCLRENGFNAPDPEPNKPGHIEVPADMPDDEIDAIIAECEEAAGLQQMDSGPRPEDMAAAREFSECMRANGIEAFPDPEADGGHYFDLPMDDEFDAAFEVCSGGSGQIVGD